ncbi:unnamed protein product [Fraxinus pennsylvanica]|uniref:Uncharacterized protein n=1 Tax=Fraxinus pennsylvanica TaxID=56036 RepID=A0AAD2E6S0_9LAMI|nr:unnamed protein product [Fraxinus pennsylvanica]
MNEENEILGFCALSEGCISYIISFTSSKAACIASAVSLAFKSAAESNTVWKRFLPPDYQDIIAKSVSPVIYCSKKELYFHLCDSPLLRDDGKLTNYAAYLVFKTHQNSYGLDSSSKASVKLVQQSIAEIEGKNNIVYLKQPTRRHGRLRQLGVKNIDGWLAKERRDGWMEIELGEYFNDKGDEGDIQMQLLEIEKLHWKGGLIIEGIELRPKEV